MGKIKDKIKYVLEPKINVENFYFGDKVYVLEMKYMGDGHALVTKTKLLKSDVLYCKVDNFFYDFIGDISHGDYYIVGDGYYTSITQAYKVYRLTKPDALKAYGIPLKKFVDQDKILKKDLAETVEKIIYSYEYAKVKRLYREKYNDTVLDMNL